MRRNALWPTAVIFVTLAVPAAARSPVPTTQQAVQAARYGAALGLHRDGDKRLNAQ